MIKMSILNIWNNFLVIRLNLKKFILKKNLLNFTVNHEKRINEYLKSLKSLGALIVDQHKKIKAVGSRRGILYCISKVYKNIGTSAIRTPSCKITTFLVPRMNSVTSNELIVKDTFHFEKEIVEQDSSFVMGSLSVDLLFINIPLDETIDICTKTVYNEQDVIQGINKEKFRHFPSLATKKSNFIFKEVSYKQKDGVAMGSPLDPTLANAFLCFYEKNGLKNALLNLNQFFIKDMLMIFFFIQTNRSSQKIS